MNEPPLEPQEPSPPGPPPSTPVSQDFTHTAVAARVPEKVLRGVFCSGTLILQTQDEFLLDFISAMTQPQQLVARVVMNARTLMQFVPALQANLAKFEQQFGPLRAGGHVPAAESPPAAPPGTPPGVTVVSTSESAGSPGGEEGVKSPPPAGPSFHDFYDQLKIPDELLGGAFANAVIIRHTPHEFCFEFIANFFPRSVVTNRIFMAAGRVPSFYDTLRSSLQKYQNRSRES